MKIRERYECTYGATWEIISTDGPKDFPIVAKRVDLIDSNTVRVFKTDGWSASQGTGDLVLTKTAWLAVYKNGSKGLFTNRPDPHNDHAAIVKVKYSNGQFDPL